SQQGVAAQVEETVLHAHPGHPQHLREQLAQDLLPRRGRPRPAPPRPGRRRRQRPPVQLPVHRQRQLTQHHHRGHHVLRQHPRHRITHPPRINPPARHRHHIPHQPPVTRPVLPHHHRRLAHPAPPQQHPLDLPHLHPEPPPRDLPS